MFESTPTVNMAILT